MSLKVIESARGKIILPRADSITFGEYSPGFTWFVWYQEVIFVRHIVIK